MAKIVSFLIVYLLGSYKVLSFAVFLFEVYQLKFFCTKPLVKVKKVQPVSKPEPVEYTIQVFSGRSKRNAEKLVQRLKDEGFPGAYIFKHITSDSKSLYRVRVGRMGKPDINSLARRIKTLKFIESTQVTRF